MSIDMVARSGATSGACTRSAMAERRVVGMIAAALLMLVVVSLPCEVSARRGRRPLEDEEEDWDADWSDGSSLTMRMLHRDHIDSPLRDASKNLTFGERMKNAAERSKERSKSVRSSIESALGSEGSARPKGSKLLGVESQVYYSQQGEFVMKLAFGTPSQKFVAIVDSGSDLNWVQCRGCTTCIPTPNPRFNPSLSSTFVREPCGTADCNALPRNGMTCNPTCKYTYDYGDGTSSIGNLAKDTLQLDSTAGGGAVTRIANFTFGCGLISVGDLAGTDGVVGIGMGRLSLPSQLSSKMGKKMSFCLVSLDDAETATSPLIIGDEAFLGSTGSNWTPLLRVAHSPTWYFVQINCIKVDGVFLGVSNTVFRAGTILDTGTTFTEIVQTAYDALVLQLITVLSYVQVAGDLYGFDLCFDVGSDLSPVWPDITFGFLGQDWTPPSENFFMHVDQTVYCLAASAGDGISIIGNLQLQNTQVFINRTADATYNGAVGFKTAQCSTLP